MKKVFALVAILMLTTSCGHWGKGGYYKKWDANKDGQITTEEWMAKFNKKDKNGDGVITQDEMKSKKCKCKKSCDYKNNKNK